MALTAGQPSSKTLSIGKSAGHHFVKKLPPINFTPKKREPMSGKIIANKKNQKLTVRTEIWNTQVGEGIKAVVRNPNGTFDGATNQTRLVKLPQAQVVEKVVVKTVVEPRKKIFGLF
jgi:hypothetical protein